MCLVYGVPANAWTEGESNPMSEDGNPAPETLRTRPSSTHSVIVSKKKPPDEGALWSTNGFVHSRLAI